MAACSPGSVIAPSVTDQFLALVCADEQLLRDEFDAIIADAWPTPPQAHKPVAGVPRPWFRSRRARSTSRSPQRRRPGRPEEVELSPRQRSPPAPR